MTDEITALRARLAEVEKERDEMRLSRNHWASQLGRAEAALVAAKHELEVIKSDRMFVAGCNVGYTACLDQMSDAACVRHSFDGFGWQYSDAANGSNWFAVAMTMPDAEPLYESPDRMSVCAALSPTGGNADAR